MVDIVTIFAMIGVLVVALLALTFCIFLLGFFLEFVCLAGWLGFKIAGRISRRFMKAKETAEEFSQPKAKADS